MASFVVPSFVTVSFVNNFDYILVEKSSRRVVAVRLHQTHASLSMAALLIRLSSPSEHQYLICTRHPCSAGISQLLSPI